MKSKQLGAALAISLTALGGAMAQQGEPAQPVEVAMAPNPANMISSAEVIVTRGNNLARTIRNLLDKARRESDIIRVTCLNDKLTQVDVNLRNAEQRLESLRNAADPDRRKHEHTVLTVLGQKFQVLGLEANQCIGQDLYETGATRVETDIDTSMLPFDERPASDPPPPTMMSAVGPNFVEDIGDDPVDVPEYASSSR